MSGWLLGGMSRGLAGWLAGAAAGLGGCLAAWRPPPAQLHLLPSALAPPLPTQTPSHPQHRTPDPLSPCHGTSDHWRKNTPVLGRSHRAYAIDLLGYGYSDKPNPRWALGVGRCIHYICTDDGCSEELWLQRRGQATPLQCPKAGKATKLTRAPHPSPPPPLRSAPPNTIYNFDQWGTQLADFVEQVVGGPAFISTNSVGGGWVGWLPGGC